MNELASTYLWMSYWRSGRFFITHFFRPLRPNFWSRFTKWRIRFKCCIIQQQRKKEGARKVVIPSDRWCLAWQIASYCSIHQRRSRHFAYFRWPRRSLRPRLDFEGQASWRSLKASQYSTYVLCSSSEHEFMIFCKLFKWTSKYWLNQYEDI